MVGILMVKLVLSDYLRVVAISCLMGENVKVRSLPNGRMEVSHLDNRSNYPSVAQDLQN